MRDKKFIIASIKMDLYRVVTAAGNINKELPQQSVLEFIKHAENDFAKVNLTDREKGLQQQLMRLETQLPQITDPHSRLKWVEDVLTIRCRL